MAVEGTIHMPIGSGVWKNSEGEAGVMQIDQAITEGHLRPAPDITVRLREWYDKPWNWGPIAFSRAYNDAPNPNLTSNQWGPIGLPFAERDAGTIRQALFVDESMSGVEEKSSLWEMDSSKIAVANKSWEIFLERALVEVCAGLDVDYDHSQPRCELQKVYLCGPGASVLPCAGNASAPHAFGTLMVVLPSSNSNFPTRVSYDGELMTFDNPCDMSTTTVMAWYKSARHDVLPSTQGHRLILSYSLLHTTEAPLPTLSLKADFRGAIKSAFEAWKQRAQNSPEKVAFLLDFDYEDDDFKLVEMKGTDAHIVPILSSVAIELGFHVGFATAECEAYRSGPDRYEPDVVSSSDDDSDSPSNWPPAQSIRRHLDFGFLAKVTGSMEKLVDVEGCLISKKLEFVVSDEAVPGNMLDVMREDDPYDQDFDSGGGDNGELFRWYHRSVVVIWPPSSDFAVRYTEDLHAAGAVLSLITPETSRDEHEGLIQFVLMRFRQEPRYVIEVLCHAASVWRDPSLWVHAVSTASRDEGLAVFSSMDSVWNAITAFGFVSIEPALNALLENEPRNCVRLKFLEKMDTWLSTLEAPEIVALAQLWRKSSTQVVLLTLHKAHKLDRKEEPKAIVSAALKHGGVPFLVDCVLPQVKDLNYDWFLHDLALHMLEVSEIDNTEQKKTIASNLLSAAITAADFSPEHALPVAEKLLKTCMGRFNSLNNTILARVTNISADMTIGQTRTYVHGSVHPLLQFIVEEVHEVGSQETKISLLSGLCAVVTLSLHHYNKTRDRFCRADESTADVKWLRALARVASWEGGWDVVVSQVLPSLEEQAFHADAFAAFIDELCRNPALSSTAAVSAPEITAVIISLAKKFTAQKDVLSNPEALSNGVRFCFSVNAIEGGIELIRPWLAKDRLEDPRHLKDMLIPLLPYLYPLAEKHQQIDLLAPIIRQILHAWIDMASAHTALVANIGAWGCSCMHCSHARTWLLSASPEKMIKLRKIGEPQRVHVDLIARLRVPQGLEVKSRMSSAFEASQISSPLWVAGIDTSL
ncbi:hypothetical protein EIP91_010652 [Steccherinum ochraceum]|uniref:Prolyl 4-hydroxylase alpha subunit Fe(2+) 2OG dioxygenase domain-containing protein n=1 Tax=Steccherinum ochraceum TaxID=92696 RepID=A0A4V6N784_9APHY|nr:hypothetical protein EIP91_010652 [Steccherinum ochraceum]